jgi:hypothetical protein
MRRIGQFRFGRDSFQTRSNSQRSCGITGIIRFVGVAEWDAARRRKAINGAPQPAERHISVVRGG